MKLRNPDFTIDYLLDMNPRDVAYKFAAAINRHDVDVICDLMSDDHRFIDGMGTVGEGRAEMEKGWIGYFDMVPDYRIDVTETFSSENTVVMLGMASGTYTSDGTLKPGNFWKTPAAWRAVIAGDKVKIWQIFADNEPIREVMRKENS